MVIRIFDRHKNSYPVEIDPNAIWGINVYDYNGDEVLEFIMGDFSARTIDVTTITGEDITYMTKHYSVGKKDLAKWCEEREKCI